jgi:F-type H+-transporting ATPase subunit gamma
MTLEQTQRRRRAVGTIHDVVSAMRAIAAGRIQSAQRALAGARHYEEVVRGAIAALVADGAELPPAAGEATQTTLLLLTSEQPLCGSFNQDLLALAERRWHELQAQGSAHLLAVGQRGARHLLAHGITPNRVEPAATSVQGLRDLVKRLATSVDQRYAAGGLGELRVIYSHYQSLSEHIPTEERVLPVDLEPLRAGAPLARRRCDRFLPVPVLLAGLLGEYAFIRLFRLAAESYASEQASRLIAMDGATRNTERIGQELLDLERRERQGEITRQVLELIGARFAAE